MASRNPYAAYERALDELDILESKVDQARGRVSQHEDESWESTQAIIELASLERAFNKQLRTVTDLERRVEVVGV